MQRKETYNLHVQIANDTLYYIYKHIDTDINIDDLALSFNISKFHLHKIFKEQMSTNIYETIKSIRLQKASNLLITNKYSTITQIANMCGYSSQTSFIRAFKSRFNQTPKVWRNGGYKDYSNKILNMPNMCEEEKERFEKLKVNIVKTKSQKVYYIKLKGYFAKEAKQTWQQMQGWIYTNDIKEHEQIGIYHDNPIITPAKDCFFMACVTPKNDKNLANTTLPSLEIEGSLFASFEIKGKYGDILRLVQWAYHEWLPNSGFETTTNPSYAVFKKNHFLEEDGLFDALFYLPIRYL